jgi:hypothetical protein
MRIFTVILSLMLATTLATTADAAKRMRHHRAPAMASKTDWAANPYMDATQGQRDAFFRGAFLMGDAK